MFLVLLKINLKIKNLIILFYIIGQPSGKTKALS